MTLNELQLYFKKYQDEYIKFERVERKKSKRADLHAFLLLDSLVPNDSDIVVGANHDEIYLNTDIYEFCKVATEEHIIELIRCGVMLHEFGGFYMFC